MTYVCAMIAAIRATSLGTVWGARQLKKPPRSYRLGL